MGTVVCAPTRSLGALCSLAVTLPRISYQMAQPGPSRSREPWFVDGGIFIELDRRTVHGGYRAGASSQPSLPPELCGAPSKRPPSQNCASWSRLAGYRSPSPSGHSAPCRPPLQPPSTMSRPTAFSLQKSTASGPCSLGPQGSPPPLQSWGSISEQEMLWCRDSIS